MIKFNDQVQVVDWIARILKKDWHTAFGMAMRLDELGYLEHTNDDDDGFILDVTGLLQVGG